MSEIVLYTTEDGLTHLNLRVDADTVWLTQMEIAGLFQTTKQNVSLHAKNIFEDGELAENSVVKESLTTAADGKAYKTKIYNLDLILAIGYGKGGGSMTFPTDFPCITWSVALGVASTTPATPRAELRLRTAHHGGLLFCGPLIFLFSQVRKESSFP